MVDVVDGVVIVVEGGTVDCAAPVVDVVLFAAPESSAGEHDTAISATARKMAARRMARR